ncbi:hypothetical protein SpCBS45565_g00384 [Spizellomyces sp. 'palustris']|nr:hypothetical protein SpCBS45565_g00384 [Spizellomyces sp. 'palustris']
MAKAPTDYALRVRAGPSYDPTSHVTVSVNDEANPIIIDSEHFTGYILVRMANYIGLAADNSSTPISNPQSHYFHGRNRRYSIMIQGRFKKKWNGDDILFGVDFDTKVRTPTGVSLALKIAKWLDPALDASLSGDKPWIFSPLLSAMNSLAVYKIDAPEVNDVLPAVDTSAHAMAEKDGPPKIKGNKVHPHTNGSPNQSGHAVEGENWVWDAAVGVGDAVDSTTAAIEGMSIKSSVKPSAPQSPPSINVGTWSFHSRLVPEDPTLLFPDASKAPALTAYEKRKKHFAEAKARKEAAFLPELVYCMDYYDAYFEFNTISLKLPGFSVNAFKYWDGQPVRFVCRSRDKSAVFFVVQFELLDRAKLGIPPARLDVSIPVMTAEALEDPVVSP